MDLVGQAQVDGVGDGFEAIGATATASTVATASTIATAVRTPLRSRIGVVAIGAIAISAAGIPRACTAVSCIAGLHRTRIDAVRWLGIRVVLTVVEFGIFLFG